MSKKHTDILNLEQFLTQEELVQLTNVIQFYGTEDIADILRTHIADQYSDMLQGSSHMTLREFFMNRIVMLQEYNISCDGLIITDAQVKAIQDGQLKDNIKGFAVSCKYPDALILNYSVEPDVEVPRYNEAKMGWETALSINIFFETPAGDFVYVSAINTIKTKSSFDKYMEHLKHIRQCA